MFGAETYRDRLTGLSLVNKRSTETLQQGQVCQQLVALRVEAAVGKQEDEAF